MSCSGLVFGCWDGKLLCRVQISMLTCVLDLYGTVMGMVAGGENRDKCDYTGSRVESLGWSSRVLSSRVLSLRPVVTRRFGAEHGRARLVSLSIQHTAHSNNVA